MKTIKLSVHEFAIPMPLSGSLTAGKGFTPDMRKGIELHQLHQKNKKRKNVDYQAERKISASFTQEERKFQIEGRMDGFIPGPIPRIEEIKSSVSVKPLIREIRKDPYAHPYGLQLLTYGYFYWLEFKVEPELSFQFISTHDGSLEELNLGFEKNRYEAWLKLRLEDLSREAERAEKRVARRKRLGKKLVFPFEKPRTGQMELIEFIEKGFVDKKRIMLQAPTGLGKTIGVLYPSLKEALIRGQRVVYLTPKNSQQRVAEEAVHKIQSLGCKVKPLTLTAKSKICMQKEPICDPSLCEYAKDYFDKLKSHEIIDRLAEKKNLHSRVFKKIAEEFKVCPFELQLDVLQEADVVIGDYNHVLSDRGSIKRMSALDHVQTGSPNLVIDEVHNLPDRAMSYYSPEMSCWNLIQIKQTMTSAKSQALARECVSLVARLSVGTRKIIEVDPQDFIQMDLRIKALIAESAQSDEFNDQSLLKLSFMWSEMTEALELAAEKRGGEFFVAHWPDEHGGTLKVTCCDASALIQGKYEDYENVVTFSATLKPFDYYARLTGLSGENLRTAEFASPFDPERRKILLIPQISTKYSERERHYGKVAETISRISSLKSGNYIAFFPSFEFLDRTLPLIQLPVGFRLVRQEKSMKSSQVDSLLDEMRKNETPTIVCAVQGGMLSEGVDYLGDMLIGAFVVGPPLPSFNFERERMREYYEKAYAEGFDYAYSYPAMAKAVQSAGRVIRSESDRGIIVLMDSRFLSPSYAKSMPNDWFARSPHELISKGILAELREFWDAQA